MKKLNDPYLRFTKDITPRIGCTILDEVRLSPGPSLTRAFERIADEEDRRFNRNPATILCKGAALGIDEAGEVGHFWPGRGLKFIGYLEGNAEKELAVKTRGSVVLSIPDASEGNRGDRVYCAGPNTFTLSPTRGAAEIGRVRYWQAGRSTVAFRREGDERPLDLKIGSH